MNDLLGRVRDEAQRLRGRDPRLMRDDRALPPARLPRDVLEPPAPPAPPRLRDLRRERRQLSTRLAALQADLGGLAMEMARQNHFNYPLLRGRAVEAVEIERRLREIETRIIAERERAEAAGGPPGLPAAPPVAAEPPPPPEPVLACPSCGGAARVDANFCAYCGAVIAAAREEAGERDARRVR